MTGDRDWSAPNHMLDRLNWRYQFDYEICDLVIQLIAISARTTILCASNVEYSVALCRQTFPRTFTSMFFARPIRNIIFRV